MSDSYAFGRNLQFSKRDRASRISRISPPTYVSVEVYELFQSIVADYPADHFCSADTEHLRAYCEAAVLNRQAHREIGGELLVPSPKGTKVANPLIAITTATAGCMNNLGMRLRITPSARSKPQDNIVPEYNAEGVSSKSHLLASPVVARR